MKIALTILSKESKPMMVVEFQKYAQLRQYWRLRKDKIKFTIDRVDDEELKRMRSECRTLKPEAGSGFRLVEPHEVLQEGDQWWSEPSSKWMPTSCTGQLPTATTTYRRPHLEEGYRLLVTGDVICPGDEYKRDDMEEWALSSLDGCVIDLRSSTTESILYRRKFPKLDWPAGCKVLRAHETTQEGDLYYNGAGGWIPVFAFGFKVGGGEGYFIRPS